MTRGNSPFPIWCSVVLLVLSGVFSVAHAQVLYGSLTGNVTDPTDAGVPGAKVEAANVDTGLSRQADTDVRGAYVFSNLQLGRYKVTVTANGFQTTAISDVAVNANEVRRVDVKLQ